MIKNVGKLHAFVLRGCINIDKVAYAIAILSDAVILFFFFIGL